ncbi:hypothetical protein ACOJR9_18435 [Alteromonas sp. A081]|uniref:hypothetical protein n=1 Tax=Alteromonas sp. A081 TaxID=3410269 RepID=UPI003B984B54
MQNKLSVFYRQKPHNDSLNVSGTILGFMVLLTGGLFLFYAFLDMIVRLESIQTVLYIFAGIAMYKTGQSLLKHFASFKSHTERRRSPGR